MIDWKKAVSIAQASANEMLGRGNTSVEEIEREDYQGRDVWSITLGYPASPFAVPPALAPVVGERLIYKKFLIDSMTGEMLAMKLREVAYS